MALRELFRIDSTPLLKDKPRKVMNVSAGDSGVLVLCGECWHELERKPHIHGYQHMEDNTRYDTENRGNVITN